MLGRRIEIDRSPHANPTNLEGFRASLRRDLVPVRETIIDTWMGHIQIALKTLKGEGVRTGMDSEGFGEDYEVRFPEGSNKQHRLMFRPGAAGGIEYYSADNNINISMGRVRNVTPRDDSTIVIEGGESPTELTISANGQVALSFSPQSSTQSE